MSKLHKMPVRVPKGWRVLKAGTMRRKGDMHYMANHHSGKEWHLVAVSFGAISRADIEFYGPYIRRQSPRRRTRT
jgi:hypothetical protein